MKVLGFCLFAGLLTLMSSCIIPNKLPYFVPTESYSDGWKKGWIKNPLGLKDYDLKRVIKDSAGNEIGRINFEFYSDQTVSTKISSFSFGLLLSTEKGNFINRFNLDSLASRQIADSLLKKKIGTSVQLPYKKFYIIDADSRRWPMNISEYFLDDRRSTYRRFRLYGPFNVKENTPIRIISGDPYLDKQLAKVVFIFKSKNKIDFMTHMN